MHRLVGSGIIMMVAIFIGLKKYYGFYERKRILGCIRDGSIKIHNNLRCLCMPLYECFISGGEFFSSAAERMREGSLPGEAVKAACSSIEVLKREDREIINRFADGLCAADCRGQLSNIDLFMTDLDKQLSDAQQEIGIRGKLFLKGSILSAAAVILLLI